MLGNLRSIELRQIKSREKQIAKIRVIVGSQMFSSDLRKAVAKLENEIDKLKEEVSQRDQYAQHVAQKTVKRLKQCTS